MSNSPFFNSGKAIKKLSSFIMEIWGKGGKRKGFSRLRTPDDKLYPYGFTPPQDFYLDPSKLDPRMAEIGISQSGGYDGGSIEYGVRVFNHPSKYFQPSTSERLQHRYSTYDYQEEFARKKFVHLLDSFQDQTKTPLKAELGPTDQWKYNSLYSANKFASTKEAFLESFFQTPFDNEDPTYYGFELEIDAENSPLFNGEVLKFIKTFGKYDGEIGSREKIYDIFKTQMFKFIKSNRANADNPLSSIGNNKFQERAYYIQKIAGLDKLIENFGEGSEAKQFVDYQKDMIELDFQEDVSQNIGYLTSLYKYLSYSRTKGKYIIPENLLRFDIKIIVTDIRKFNRFVREPKQFGNKIYAFADKISRYEYKLYECQFKFDKMPHGDVIKNNDTPGTEPEPYVIKFDYKFSTLNFKRYSGKLEGSATSEAGKAYDGQITYYEIDNSKMLGTYSALEFEQGRDGSDKMTSYAISNYMKTDGDGKAHYRQNTLTGVEKESALFLKDIPTPVESGVFRAPNYGIDANDSDRLKTLSRRDKLKQALRSRIKQAVDSIKQSAGDLGKQLINAGIGEVNRQILSKAALLNKSLQNIRDGIPGLERMSAPRNVYRKYDPLETALLNAFRAGGPLVSGLLTTGYMKGKDRLKAALDKSSAYVADTPKNLTGFSNVYGPRLGPRGPL